jgi:ribosome-associated toxin RatA of RatAB toxin-antitoxin module
MMPVHCNLLGSAGGRARARRLIGCAVFIMSNFAGAAEPARAQSGPRITVNESAGVYRVAARFNVAQPPAIAMSVLTDYEHIPSFMPDVRTSRVVEHSEDHVIVEQEAVARLMMFSKQIHLVLEIHEQPGSSLQFRDRCGKSFKSYEGRWAVATKDGQTGIEYTLTAEPSFDVPEFLLRRLLKRDARRMIENLQAEVARRAQ